MSSSWNFIFSVLLLVIWIVSGGFATDANVKLGKYRKAQAVLNQAWWYLFAVAFTTWTLIGIFIVLFILSIVGVIGLMGSGIGEIGAGVKQLSQHKEHSVRTIIILLGALVLSSFTGVMAVLAALKIAPHAKLEQNKDDARLQKVYKDTIIAAALTLGSVGLLIIGILAYYAISRYNRKRNLKIQKKQTQQRLTNVVSELQNNQESTLKNIQDDGGKLNKAETISKSIEDHPTIQQVPTDTSNDIAKFITENPTTTKEIIKTKMDAKAIQDYTEKKQYLNELKELERSIILNKAKVYNSQLENKLNSK